MMRALVAAALMLALPFPAIAKEPAQQEASPPNMERYQLVLLRRGPSWTPKETPEVARLQEAHLAHLRRMGERGKMVVAGPFGDQADETLRGMCLYRVDTAAEARTLAEADPAVKAGRLKVEVMSWYVEKGALVFPRLRKAASP